MYDLSGMRKIIKAGAEVFYWFRLMAVLVVMLSIQDGWTFYARHPAAIGLAMCIGILGGVLGLIWQKITPMLRRRFKLGLLGVATIVPPQMACQLHLSRLSG